MLGAKRRRACAGRVLGVCWPGLGGVAARDPALGPEETWVGVGGLLRLFAALNQPREAGQQLPVGGPEGSSSQLCRSGQMNTSLQR